MPKKKAVANGEGSIYQRKRDGKWCCELTIGWGEEGKRKSIRFFADTRKEVVAWRTARLNEKQTTGELIEPSKQKLSQFMEHWINTTAVHEVKSATIDLYRQVFRAHIKPDLGEKPLGKVTAQHIQAFYHKRLQAGTSPRTIQIVHSVLRRALQQAVEWRLLPRNVADFVKRPRAERHEVEPLTPDQVMTFLEAAQEDRLHALFTLAATTGLRLGELLALRWSDINLAESTLTVRQTLTKNDGKFEIGTPKTNASRRTLDLPVIACKALKRWRREQAAERLKLSGAWATDLVFTTTIGTVLNPHNIRNRSLKSVLERAGLPKIRFHDLRHTAATLMLAQGVQPRVLQDVLGHSDIRMTLGLYSHVLREQKKAAAQAIDTFIQTAQK